MAAITFTITRTGDLSRDGSVDYTIEYDLAASDFAPGQSKTGTVSWAANETAAKTVTYTTVGNTTENPDRYLRLVLSNPVNATIGTDRATTTILDDEATANLDYVPDLAFGGIMLGAAIVDGAPGNTVCRYSDKDAGNGLDAVIMYLEHDDPIVAIACENRLDHYPLGSTAGGYSDRTVVNDGSGGNRKALPEDKNESWVVAEARGGNLKWRVAKVIGPAEGSSGGLVLEKVGSTTAIRWAGETDTIASCGRNASWNTEYQRCGGSGTATARFSGSADGGGYPTIWFTDGNGTLKPIKPSDWGWQIGDRIAFCLINTFATDSGSAENAMQPPYGTAGYMSLNHSHRLSRPLRKSTYRYMAYSGVYWSTQANAADRAQRYAPCMLVGYRGADNKMHIKGNAYTGDSSQNYDFTRIRQIIYIPDDSRWTGRRIIGFDAGVWRNSSSIGGNLTLRLSRATAGSVGAASDNGTLLGSRVIAGSSVLVGGGRSGAADAVPNAVVNMGSDPGDWVTNAVLTVKAGEAYYLEMQGSVSGYTIGFMLNYIGRAPNLSAGLNKADHQDLRNKIQPRSGSSWTNDLGGNLGSQTDSANYNMIGCALHLRA